MTATPHHPGEILACKLEALDVTPTELARQLHVPANRITQIVNGQRSITGDTALRLAHWFSNSPEYWMSLQTRYDLENARTEAGREIDELPMRPHRSARRAKNPAKPARGRAAGKGKSVGAAVA